MRNSLYKKIIKTSTIGYAYYKVVLDENGKAIDHLFIEVNDYFLKLFGLKAEEVIGKKASEALKYNIHLEINGVEIFNDVSLIGESKEYEQYFPAIDRSFKIKLFSPKKNYVVVLINEINQIEKILLDTDDRYKMIINNMNDSLWIVDPEFKFTYLSPSIQKAVLYTPEELMKLHFKQVLTPTSYEYLKNAYKEEMAIERLKKSNHDRARIIELDHVRKDGSIVTMEHVMQFLRDENNQINGIMGLARDITEWNEAKENLRKNKEQLQLILDSTGEGIYGIDLNGNCTFCNASCLRLLGYEHQDDLLNKNINMILYPPKYDNNVIPINDSKLKRIIESKSGTYTENEVLWRKDGTYFIAELFSYPQYHEGEIVGAVVTFFDITARMEVERELKESERSKAVLLENLPGMAYRCNFDRNWTMQFVSEGCYNLTGYKPDDLINNKKISFNEIMKPQYREQVWDLWNKLIGTNDNFRQEYEIITAKKEVKWVLEQGQIIYDANGEVEALEGLIIDITDQKRKQEEVEYLSLHDNLTGLYNRIYFEKERQRLEDEKYLPLSLIIGDINGLKLLNDALGHDEGDQLIKATAKVLKSCICEGQVLARTSGDEFNILLPNTNSVDAYEIMKSIQKAFEKYNSDISNESYKINFALGFATKETIHDEYSKVQKIAEDYMYKRKLLERNSSHSAIISSIKTTMYEKSHETEEHAERLQELSRMVGIKINLSQVQLDELALLATLHDIGKVGIDDKILNKPGVLTDEEWVEMKKHPEIGYRIAMASPELISIANYILCHHEKWDGTGYPQGLKGDQIPLLSRIISVVDAYDAMTQDRSYRKKMDKYTALSEIKAKAGSQFDPNAAEVFIDIMLNEDIDIQAN